MKKLLFAFSIAALLAVGCNSNQQANSQVSVQAPSPISSPSTTPVSPDPMANWKAYINNTYGFQFKYPQEDYLYGEFLDSSGKSSGTDAQIQSLNSGITPVNRPYLTLEFTSLAGLPLVDNGEYPNTVTQKDLIKQKMILDNTPVGGSSTDSGNTDVASDVGHHLYDTIIPVGPNKIDVFVAHAAQAPAIELEFLAFNSRGDRIEIIYGDSDLSTSYMNSLEAGGTAPEPTTSQIQNSPNWEEFLNIAHSFQLVAN